MQSEGSSGDPPPILPRDYPLDSGTQNSRECARMEEDMCTTDQHDGKGNSRTRSVGVYQKILDPNSPNRSVLIERIHWGEFEVESTLDNSRRIECAFEVSF